MTVPVAHASRHTFDGAFRVFVAEALFVPSALITTAYLTRHLGSGGYGAFAIATTAVTWLQWTISSAFTRSTQALVGAADDWRPVGTAVLRLQLAAGLLAGVALWLFADAIAALLRSPELSRYLRLYSVELPLFCAAAAHRDILIGLGRYRARAAASAGRWTARPLLIVLMVTLGFSVEGAIAGSIGALTLELAIYRLLVKPSLFRGATAMRTLLGHAAPLFLFALVVRLLDKLDLFALQLVSGDARLAGFYAAAQNISLAPSLVALAFSPLLLASLSRLLRAGARADALQLVRQGLRVPFLLVPGAAMVAGASPGVVRLVFGAEFAPAAPLLAPLLAAAMAFFTLSVCSAMLISTGRVVLPVTLAAPLLPVIVVALAIVVPREGMVGAAFVTAAVAVLGAAMSLVAVHRVWAVAPPPATIARTMFLAVGMATWGVMLPMSPVLLVAGLSVGVLVIGVGFLVLREFSPGELAHAREIFRPRLAARTGA